MVLIPQVVDAVKIPVIAAGGIIDGRGIAAALALGAHGAQLGTRFVVTQESSAHEHFKQAILNSNPASTMLTMKKHIPVRLMKNAFFDEIKKLEDQCASEEEIVKLLGHGRARAGMLEGDMTNGEIEIGQGCSLIHDCPTVADVVSQLISDYQKTKTILANAF
jgi:enoyl-[acyl-carrier protein] reductase II